MICCSHEVDWWGMLGPGFCFFVMWCSVFLLCQVSSSHVVSQIMLLFVSSHVMLYVMLSFVFPLCDSVSRHVLASCHVSSQSSHVELRVESCWVESRVLSSQVMSRPVRSSPDLLWGVSCIICEQFMPPQVLYQVELYRIMSSHVQSIFEFPHFNPSRDYGWWYVKVLHTNGEWVSATVAIV